MGTRDVTFPSPYPLGTLESITGQGRVRDSVVVRASNMAEMHLAPACRGLPRARILATPRFKGLHGVPNTPASRWPTHLIAIARQPHPP